MVWVRVSARLRLLALTRAAAPPALPRWQPAGVVFGGVVYTSAHPERPAQRSSQKATSLQRACQQLPCCQRKCVTLQPP